MTLALLLLPLFGPGCGGWTPVTGSSEVECDDQVDDDDDTLVDCDDPDCDGETACEWPAAIDLDGRFDFEANTVGAIGGLRDCTIRYTSTLARERDAECAQCDRTFHGSFQYREDDCPSTSATPRPTEGSYGFTFTSQAQWQVYFQNADDSWQIMGTAGHDGSGTYRFTQTDPVVYEATEVGDLQTTYWFTEP